MAKVIKPCSQCGTTFTVYVYSYQPEPAYCSRECRHAAHTVQRQCPRCGTTFTHPICQERIYCSQKCSASVNARANSGGDSFEVTCDQCGKLFRKKAAEYTKTTRHFCCRKCTGVWLSVNTRGENNSRYNSVERTCEQCNKPFVTWPSEVAKGWGRFCCQPCAHAWKVGRNTGPDNPGWKGGWEPYYGPNWGAQRKQARRRDGYRCQVCNVHEKKLRRRLDVHHVVPFRIFGPERYQEANDLTNLICLCAKCHKEAENGRVAIRPKLL